LCGRNSGARRQSSVRGRSRPQPWCAGQEAQAALKLSPAVKFVLPEALRGRGCRLRCNSIAGGRARPPMARPVEQTAWHAGV